MSSCVNLCCYSHVDFILFRWTDTFVLLEQSNPVLNGSLAETINNFFVSVSAHLPPFDSSVIHGIQPDLPAQYRAYCGQTVRSCLKGIWGSKPTPDRKLSVTCVGIIIKELED